jgi:hypothetical protein
VTGITSCSAWVHLGNIKYTGITINIELVYFGILKKQLKNRKTLWKNITHKNKNNKWKKIKWKKSPSGFEPKATRLPPNIHLNPT